MRKERKHFTSEESPPGGGVMDETDCSR